MSDVSLSKAVRSNLLSLQNTATMMAKTQERLATGNKVNSALDNPTNFFTASALNSRAGDLNSLLDNMANGVKTLEAADNGLSAITKTLESMNSTLRQARQDKSFQVASFDVTADSVLNIGGGTLDAEGISVSLAAADPGVKASVSTGSNFTGPVPAAANELGAGAGARTTVTLDAANALAGAAISVDDHELTLDGASNTAALAAADIQTKLNALAGDGAYTVGFTADNEIIIENSATTGATSTAPVVDLGATAAVTGSQTFTYDASRFQGSFSVGGTAYAVDGANVNDFVASLQEQVGAAYVVSNEGNDVTITNATVGGVAPTLSLPSATQATTTFNIGAVTDDTRDGQTFMVAGQEVTVAWSTDATGTNGAMEAAISQALDDAGLDPTDYTVAVDSTTGAVSITADTAGASNAVTAGNGTVTLTNNNAVNGLAAIAPTTTVGAAGTTQEATAAAKQTFNVTYGNKTTEITIGAGEPADIASSINSQLQAAGIKAEATIGDDGALSISATSAEAKTLAISGGNSAAIFGDNDTVAVGTAATAPINATKAVDKFVELINRDHGVSIRASNDNGRLRIENLSTTEMNVSADKVGDGTFTDTKIGGNSVREGLAGQFNELKDQLNKLADDASFNGINLLRGDQLTITFNETGNSFMQIKAGDQRGINSQSLNLNDLVGSDFDSDANIDKLLGDIKLALNSVRSQASAFGSNLSIVQNRQDFTKNMINTLETGAANLTLADMNEEAANLLALQTRQSLSSSALSMASQADQSVLQLLR
ncbi:flagellin N-terminal helical domain-containing protein [Devosia faecipullorum]|uniref:flagellin N-terminal helical domain-containing protein n=1 Tax=Devosia faecipullorum TaxID=2755039 RepID=UPI00187B969F|nr:flagellin [Devosia faecipullorum]MBE7732106.1 hypothetical protein [Devosia faecipullorum]